MDEEREIDLAEVIRDIIKNYKKLLLISVIFAVAIGVFGGIKQYNSNETTGKLLIIQERDIPRSITNSNATYEEYKNNLIEINNQSETYNQYDYKSLSINDIKMILSSQKLLDVVYDNCNFKQELDIEKEDIDYSDIFEIKSETGSNIITITCKLKDTELAKMAINNLVDTFKENQNNYLKLDAAELIDGPTTEEKGLVSSLVKYGVIGAIVGSIVYCAYVFMKHVFDNLVRSESEIKDILNYHTISYKDSKNTEEIVNLLQRKKAKVINFIDIDNNGSKARLIDEIAQELKNSRKKVKIVNALDGKINIKKDKKNCDYLLINCDSTKKSHDFVNVAKMADSSLLVIEKEKAKLEDLETLKEDIDLYEINVTGTVFINK